MFDNPYSIRFTKERRQWRRDISSAWAEVERLNVPINREDVRCGLTFGDLVQHYGEHELVESAESIRPKAHTTIKGYERVLRNRLLPGWGNRIALGIEPLEVEQWLRALKKEEDLANPTLDKTRRVMSLVYKHGQRYGLIPRNQESNPMRFVRRYIPPDLCTVSQDTQSTGT